MRTLLTVLAVLMTGSAVAANHKYQCYLTTDKDDTISFDLSGESLKLHDQYRVLGLEPYKVKRGSAILENRGFKGGNGKMKDRLVFSVNYERSEVVSENTSHYYLEKELLTGGKVLRNGARGGYVTFEGHGYSYESYLCFLRN
ncbi:MAG TPA: hypothetical protein VNJ01_03325 [Bacteriovoracaceae bacterium]|nr:hypothetical protein [Bacteriovoracaceae bacterium]